MKKIIRITTVPLSLDIFCRGLLKELSQDYEVVAVSSPGKELDAVAAREGVRTVSVPMRRRPAPAHDLVSLMRLYRLFRKEKPDMVHSMTPKAGLLAMTASRMAGVPVRVHTFTGLVFPSVTGLRRRVFLATDRLTAASATHVVPEGEGVRSDLLRYRVTRKPMEVLGYGNVRGIDLGHYDRTPEVLEAAERIRQGFGITDDAFTYVFVGRFDPDKGFEELLRAFTRLLDSGREYHLLLVGDFEEGTSPVSAWAKAQMDGCPSIHLSSGWQDDVRPWMAAADALVHPSYREGFPNVVIEAGAMGLPSVVTDINGSREIVSDGVNGLVVPAKDSESLYEAMKSLSDDPQLAGRLSSNARRIVEERYEQGFVRKCLKEYYSRILS